MNKKSVLFVAPYLLAIGGVAAAYAVSESAALYIALFVITLPVSVVAVPLFVLVAGGLDAVVGKYVTETLGGVLFVAFWIVVATLQVMLLVAVTRIVRDTLRRRRGRFARPLDESS